jgi:pyrophosphate--fructose-6-phosphate 1-phosphotransferase
LISEEIEKKDMTLNQIVENLCNVIAYRASKGWNFGTVLIPEGLIEFIPAIGRLIDELNDLLAAHGADYKDLDKDAQRAYIVAHLSEANKDTFETLPEGVARQLSLDRDPHGNVQVSLIETEKLLSDMCEIKLAKWAQAGKYDGKFAAQHHFFGYEGRCAAPSNFDADYCYALGTSAAQLIANGKTGYMAIVKNTTAKTDDWKAGGVPITMMMNMERRNGEMKPVIRKALVELDGKPFKTFEAERDEWAKNTCYIYPGPIQYWGPSDVCDQTTKTLELERK